MRKAGWKAHNFSIRKNIIEYDDVMNQQREIIYRQRHEALRGENLKPNIFDMIEDLLDAIVEESTGEKTYAEDWNLEQINKELTRIFGIQRTSPLNPLKT